MKPTEKRKHIMLSIEDKVAIINRLENGETGTSLAKIYNVGKATISEIKSKKNKLINFVSSLNSPDSFKRRKTMKKAACERLEDALYLWYIQKRDEGEYISGPLLCKRALELNEEMGGPSKFKASSGWLQNFKSRRGIMKFEHAKETLTRAFLTKLMEEEGFSEDDVYITDETNLYWNTLPSKALEWKRERDLAFTLNKERITLMFCANISGKHFLPLLVVGEPEHSECLEGVESVPVEYKAQENADMDAPTFLDWFTNNFIPNVKSYRLNENKSGNVLLLIDNLPGRPPLDQLNAINEEFVVRIFSTDEASSFQPMRFDVLQELNTMYKKQFLHQLLDKDEDSLIDFLNKFSLKDCCYILAEAWKILSRGDVHEQDLDNDLLDTVNLFQKIPGFSECAQDDAVTWLYDHDLLTEEEIVTVVKQEICTEVEQDNVEVKQEDVTGSGPTHAEALIALESAILWCERQSEFGSEEMSVLKRMRDMAEIKTLSYDVNSNS